MQQVRVLVVDDSPTMRAIIRLCLMRDPAIDVVGEAGDPYEARAAVKALSPDVITLDVNMPRMDGLAFLEKIMRLRPTPVIMISSEVGQGAAAALEALAIGAFDCVEKPAGLAGGNPFPDLAAKVKEAAAASPGTLALRLAATQARPVAAPQPDYQPGDHIVAVGASTGGVDALQTLLEAFPANCPPTVVVQHMPASFTASFALRLNAHCAPEVVEAWDGAPLQPGRVYIAPGGASHLEIAGRHRRTCRLLSGAPRSGHRPSVDMLFDSVARAGAEAVGIILTGMGRDGAEGLLAMRRAGARTLGQDAATSLVYGMPRAAAALGAVERELPLAAIAQACLALCAARDKA